MQLTLTLKSVIIIVWVNNVMVLIYLNTLGKQ